MYKIHCLFHEIFSEQVGKLLDWCNIIVKFVKSNNRVEISVMAFGLKKGSLLDHGKYRIERILGNGGFGITYLATDLGLDKLRAIKEFFPKDYCDRNESTSHITLGTSNNTDFVEKLKKKFIKEARNIANLDQHQGIITIHAVFEENNTAYYVMDYIEGENLSQKVKRDGPLPEDKAIEYITEVGHALEYVHKKHINHLDVKPANIMIRRQDDSPILIDFGLSKQYDSDGSETTTTPTGTSKGYAPKEQYIEGGVKEFSPQTDVYALAATLYYLITGKVPPHALELDDISKLNFPPDFPKKLIPGIKKAMNYKKGKRQESIEEFINSLDSNYIDYNEGEDSEETIIENPQRVDSTGEKSFQSISSSGIETKETQSVSGTKKGTNKIQKVSISKKGRGRRKYNFPAYFRKHKNAIIGICLLIIVITGGVLIAVFSSTGNSNPETIQSVEEVNSKAPKTVDNLAYKSSLGPCLYSGEVDENNLPNGHGIANWNSGEGKEYDGEWVHGVMEGHTKYTHRSGDTFEGTFKNNQYSEGKYTIKETGEYFEGKFKDGQPEEGTWYDKNGNEI